MKKIWTLVLVLVLAVSAMFVFTACNKEEPQEEPPVVETFYKVTYVYKTGDTTIELSTQQVSETAGFSAEQVAAVEKFGTNGYGFAGWYADEDCTVPFDFTAKPTADVTVYAFRGNRAGDDVEWLVSFTGNSYAIMFTGNGAMYDYDNPSDAPWADIADKVVQVTFTEGITKIGKYTCANMTSLSTVYVPASVRAVGDYAFAASAVSNVIFRNGCKTIGASAFADCTKFANIILPESLQTIGANAFYNVPAFTKAGFMGDEVNTDIETALTEGKNFKFVDNCLIDVVNKTLVVANNEATITVDASVETIADGAFYAKTALTTVYLPEKLVKIGANAFSKCTKLATVLVADQDALLLNKTAVKIQLPDTVEVIGKSAFNQCTAITGAVYLGNKITEIADAMFFGCKKISDVVVPASVANIGATAFKDCTGLNHVFFKGTEAAFNAITCGVDNYTFVDMAAHFFFAQEEPTVAGPYWFDAGKDEEGNALGYRQWAFSIRYRTASAYSSGNKFIFTDYVTIDQETYKATCGEAQVTFRENMRVDGYTYLNYSKALYTESAGTKKWTVLTANVVYDAYRTQGISEGGGIQLTYSGTTATVKLNADFDPDTMSDKTWDFGNLAATQYLWQATKVGVRRDTIKTVTLQPGIKYYGAYSLASFAMETLVIPADVESVHCTFVDNTTKLKTIYYEGTEALKVVDGEGKEVALNQLGVTIYTKYVEGDTDVTKNGAYWTEIGGKKLVWNFQDGALTIGGDAVMVDFADAADAPWADANITSVTIESGITEIGENILKGDTSVATIKLPASVRVIPASAFEGTAALTNLAAAADGCGYIDGHLIKVIDATKIGTRFDIPRSTYSVAGGAFAAATNLKEVYIVRSVGYVAADAFDGTALETIYFDGTPANFTKVLGTVDASIDVYYATISTPTIADWQNYDWFTIETEPDKTTGFRKIVAYTDENYVTVTFAVEGVDTPTEVVYIDGIGGAITVATPTKTGYKFAGWADADGNVYTKVTAELLADGDVTLTAKFTK